MCLVFAAAKQLDPAQSLDYEGAVVYCCLLQLMEWTLTESGSEHENQPCQHVDSSVHTFSNMYLFTSSPVCKEMMMNRYFKTRKYIVNYTQGSLSSNTSVFQDY